MFFSSNLSCSFPAATNNNDGGMMVKLNILSMNRQLSCSFQYSKWNPKNLDVERMKRFEYLRARSLYSTGLFLRWFSYHFNFDVCRIIPRCCSASPSTWWGRITSFIAVIDIHSTNKSHCIRSTQWDFWFEQWKWNSVPKMKQKMVI